MPFPEVKRVIYKKNPLDQVICQLRFPPILRIDAEIPANFQEKIRKDYPNFNETSESLSNFIEFPQDLRNRISSGLLQQMNQPSFKNYEFMSEDGIWKINLMRNFIALSTKKYLRWEEFKNKFQIPFNAFLEIYSPAYFSRIGLRYIDIIKRSILNLSDVSWKDLLQPYILGILGSPQVGENVREFETMHEINLDDKVSSVKIVNRFFNDENSDEIFYVIDSDFYSLNKIEIESAINKLDYFNNRSSRLIQWCIKEQLHKAMEPQDI
jgi:uncharacterized protein (TIGR04255 family)